MIKVESELKYSTYVMGWLLYVGRTGNWEALRPRSWEVGRP